MITPVEDKDVIQAILEDDKYIASLGFRAENIKKTQSSSDILSSVSPELQIFISMGAPERSFSEISSNMTYNITVTGKRENSRRVDDAVAQIIALLNHREIGRAHIMYLLDPPFELKSDSTVYIVETSYLCQCTNFNVVKKIN